MTATNYGRNLCMHLESYSIYTSTYSREVAFARSRVRMYMLPRFGSSANVFRFPAHMTDPRLSTVFDYADLRLHPDGTRVYQKPSNFRPGIVKVAVQNSRANWIARDAGGSGKIHKMRLRGKTKEQGASQEPEGDDAGAEVAEAEEIEEDVEVDEGSDGQGKSSKGTKKRKAKTVDKRKAKRQKFATDYDYLLPKPSGLHEVETHTVDDSVDDEAISLPEPSPVWYFCMCRTS